MKKVCILIIAIIMGLSIMVGCTTTDKKGGKTSVEDKDKPKAKVKVNITGEIEEIDKEGNRIKVNGKWIVINDDTRFADDPDNGSEPVSKEFKIGNEIAGWTADDISKDEVVAGAIYMNKEKPKEVKPQPKVAVNISGKIEEIDKEGNRIKVDGKWIVITDKTEFADDPDNGSEPVSKEFKIGNKISGWTADDINKDEVVAGAIYKNVEDTVN